MIFGVMFDQVFGARALHVEISDYVLKIFPRQLSVCLDQFLYLNTMINMLTGEAGCPKDTQLVPTAKQINLCIDKMPVNGQ